jgi:heme/copper-type cytochrome/quinol oxidase subunit 2
MSKFTDFLNGVKNFFTKVTDNLKKGYEWLGTDGIINMETSALLMMIFMVFFPIFWSAIITFIIVIGKCTLDKTRNRENEMHDFICAIIGILVGVILGTIHLVVHLI